MHDAVPGRSHCAIMCAPSQPTAVGHGTRCSATRRGCSQKVKSLTSKGVKSGAPVHFLGFSSEGAPVPDEPMNSVWPFGSVRSRPFALRDPSLD
jgi:hypothetical protein